MAKFRPRQASLITLWGGLFLLLTCLAAATLGIRQWVMDIPPRSEGILGEVELSIARVDHARAGGTGFLVASNVLATNKHCVENYDPNTLSVRFPCAPWYQRGPMKARLIYADPHLDLAFLEVTTPLKPLSILSGSWSTQGQEVTLIGYPGIRGASRREKTVGRGVLGSYFPATGGHHVQKVQVPSRPGNSGSPILDDQGRVVGILTNGSPQGEAFCIPSKELEAALSRLKR